MTGPPTWKVLARLLQSLTKEERKREEMRLMMISSSLRFEGKNFSNYKKPNGI